MKVLHLMNSLKASGMERMFISAAPYFQERGVDSLVVGQGEDHPFRPQLEAAGYAVGTVPAIKTAAGIKALVGLLKEQRPDVLHIHSEGAFGIATLVARFTAPKTAIVRTIHNVFQPSGKGRIKRKIESMAADRFAALFIACSPDVQRNERDLGRDATLVYNWVDDKFFDLRGTHQKKPAGINKSVVIVGNSSSVKNHQTALTALHDLPLDLYFHGDESGANQVERAILESLEKQGRLLHRGTGDPSASLVSADVYVMPSKHEGMSIALAEAIVVGTPVIINDAPGQSWAAELPGVTVLQDDVELWKEHLVAVASTDSREPVGADLPIDLSAQRGASEYADIYRSLVATGASY